MAKLSCWPTADLITIRFDTATHARETRPPLDFTNDNLGCGQANALTSRSRGTHPTMIHFTCDCCGRALDAAEDVRFVVRVEVYAAVDESVRGVEDEDSDQLEEIAEMLEQDTDMPGGDSYQTMRYDLCEECRGSLRGNPLARLAAAKIGFSEN